MRVFYLRFTKNDCIVTPTSWQSPVVNLYDNNYYQNYSTVKSLYGQQTQDGQWASATPYTWTGLDAVDGRLVGTRYIDYSGPVSVISYSFVSNADTSYSYGTTLDVACAESAYAVYPNEWVINAGFTTVGGINLDTVPPYAQFTLNFTVPPDVNAAFYVRIEIGPPVIAPKYMITQYLLNHFPKWMEMRELNYAPAATPQVDSPHSLGGAVINAVSGEWLEELQTFLQSDQYNLFIDTVDLTQMAWCYRSTGVPQYIYSLVGDGAPIGWAYDFSEFYQAAADEDVAFWDETNHIVYCNRQYTNLQINGITFVQEISRVWNALDEIGYAVDLDRLLLEDNTSYQARIKDVFINPLGVGRTQFQLALRRELDLWSVYGGTPDSAALGATPDVLNVVDIMSDPTFIQPDGLPTLRLKQLVRELANQYPTTWGHFKWDKALWDIAGPNYEGYAALPKQFDATPLSTLQSGVGDSDDLYISNPGDLTGPIEFTTSLVVRGKQLTSQQQYPQAIVDVDVVASAVGLTNISPANTVWFTVEVTLALAQESGEVSAARFGDVKLGGGAVPYPATETFYYSFSLTDTDNANPYDATPTSTSSTNIELVNSTGYLNSNFNFVEKTTGVPLYGALSVNQIENLVVKVGQFNSSTQTYDQIPSSSTFDAWFSTAPNTLLTYNSAPLEEQNIAIERLLLYMSSTLYTVQTNPWQSDTFSYAVEINGLANIASNVPATLPLPPIAWNPAAVDSREYTITITSNNGAPSPILGAYGSTYTGQSYFVDSTQIFLNGSNTWVHGSQTFPDSASLTGFTFELSGYAYPLQGQQWIPFTSDAVEVTGTVDQYGPWINGYPQKPTAQTNDVLQIMNLTRDDFGIPNTTDYIINWIGISDNQEDVVTWLETNTITPAITDGSVVYPDNSILEVETNGVYTYTPFNLYAKLVPNYKWYPQMNSGTFYEGETEYYSYATPGEEIFSASPTVLQGLARQGAPIIIRDEGATPTYFKQVVFFDNEAPIDFATPTQLSLTNTEVVNGTGQNYIYASYPDIYNVSVMDVTIPTEPMPIFIVQSEVSNNIIYTPDLTEIDHSYQITYQVHSSFYADNAYIDDNGNKRTYLEFDQYPSSSNSYVVNYEVSPWDAATPIPIPLNPLYTNIEEGFIFISHDEYPLARIVVSVNPSKIAANGNDYILISMFAIDTNDNPKPNQLLTIATDYGTLSNSSVTTDVNGFASVILTSTTTPPTGAIDPLTLLAIGNLTVTCQTLSTNITFLVQEAKLAAPSVYALVSQDQIPADCISKNVVYGRVFDENNNPVPYAVIDWAKARNNYELFNGGYFTNGTIVAGSDGGFTIGPFDSATPSGYWFISVQSDHASPSLSYSPAGDVVFWYEYPSTTEGVGNVNGFVAPPVQMLATPNSTFSYSYGVFYPSSYDESVIPSTSPAATPNIPAVVPATPWISPYPPGLANPAGQSAPQINWVPPEWYGLPSYDQYQMGLRFLAMPHPSVSDV